MDSKKLHFLVKTADVLTRELDSSDLVNELKNVLNSFIELNDLNIFVFDPNTNMKIALLLTVLLILFYGNKSNMHSLKSCLQ